MSRHRPSRFGTAVTQGLASAGMPSLPRSAATLCPRHSWDSPAKWLEYSIFDIANRQLLALSISSIAVQKYDTNPNASMPL